MAGKRYEVDEDFIQDYRRLKRKVDGMTFTGPGVTFRNMPHTISGFVSQPRKGRTPIATKKPVYVSITANAPGGGKYYGRVVQKRTATTDISPSGNLIAADLPSVDSTTPLVLILNRREVGKSTHDIATTGFLPTSFPADLVFTNTDGTPVYEIDGFQHKDCV